jgi:hypothetical protein
MRFVLPVFLAFCLPSSYAEDHSQLLLHAKAAFEKYVPANHFHDYATAFGDVNGDGINDFVTFIGDPHYNDNGVENLKVAVFLGKSDNTFIFSEATAEISGHERVSHSLEVKKQSIFLHRDGSGGCCSHWVEELQFKEFQNTISLVGLETATYHPDGANKSDFGTSTNLITGKIQGWAGTNKRSWGKATKLRGLAPIPLSSFDYEEFSQKWGQSW